MGTDLFGDYLFFYLLTLLLIILKVTLVIGWSWAIVFSPIAVILVLWVISLILSR